MISDVGDSGTPGYREGMAGNPQTEKSCYVLVMEAFWRCDKCWIIAVINRSQAIQGRLCGRREGVSYFLCAREIAGGPY
jgi:hypothetical protein